MDKRTYYKAKILNLIQPKAGTASLQSACSSLPRHLRELFFWELRGSGEVAVRYIPGRGRPVREWYRTGLAPCSEEQQEIRGRILRLLAKKERTVSELCAIGTPEEREEALAALVALGMVRVRKPALDRRSAPVYSLSVPV